MLDDERVQYDAQLLLLFRSVALQWPFLSWTVA
jgi:hypothetical protein